MDAGKFMSLEHALLGFLNYQPLSGYDLKKMFDVSVRHFWPADQSQIYRTLARLVDLGWVSGEVIAQTDRPDRKVYHITEAGREQLVAWLAGETPAAPSRSAALVQVFFAARLSDEQILALFERAAARVRVGLVRLEEVPAHLDAIAAAVPSPRERFFWDLTLESGRRTAEARLAWLEAVIDRIHRGEVPPV